MDARETNQSDRDYETYNVCSLWGFSVDTAKQGQTKTRRPKIVRRKLRVTETTEKDKNLETSCRRDHGIE